MPQSKLRKIVWPKSRRKGGLLKKPRRRDFARRKKIG